MKKNPIVSLIALTLLVVILSYVNTSSASAEVPDTVVPIQDIVNTLATSYEIGLDYQNGIVELEAFSALGTKMFHIFLEDYLFDEENETISISGAFLLLEEISVDFENAKNPRYIACSHEIPAISLERIHAFLENIIDCVFQEYVEETRAWFFTKDKSFTISIEVSGENLPLSQAYALAKATFLSKYINFSTIHVY